MKAMVLAAGLGTRLRPITYDLPKPLVPVLDRPVMSHVLTLLARHDFTDVVANLHYFPELMRKHFGDGSSWGLDLEFSYEEELLGTAGGVRNVRDQLGQGSFLVISGDGLTNIDLGALVGAHRDFGGVATLALQRVPDTRQYGVVILDEEKRVQGFQEKPDPAEALSDLCNCGIYVFEPEVFEYFPETPFADWANDVFPALLEHDVPFYGHEVDCYWNDVGNIAAYKRSNFDALAGQAGIEVPGAEREPGFHVDAGADIGDVDVSDSPVWVGPDCTIEDEVRLAGPLVIGEGSHIGRGAALRGAILLPGAKVGSKEIVIDAINGDRDATVAWLERS